MTAPLCIDCKYHLHLSDSSGLLETEKHICTYHQRRDICVVTGKELIFGNTYCFSERGTVSATACGHKGRNFKNNT